MNDKKIRKLKDRASKWLNQKKYTRALKAFRDVLSLEPSEYYCYKNIGYILRKQDRKQEAIEAFSTLADLYSDNGFLLKAIATFKVILEMDPENQQVQDKLSWLSAERNDISQKPRVKVYAEQLSASEEHRSEICQSAVQTDIYQNTSPTDIYQNTSPTDIYQSIPPATLNEEEPQASIYQSTPQEREPEENVYMSGAKDYELIIEEEPPNQRAMELPEIPLFSDLEPLALIAFLRKMNLLRFRTGDTIVHEGEFGASMFAITSGRVQVMKGTPGGGLILLARLGEGDFFGEISALQGGPRGATVKARGPVELLEIDQRVLAELTQEFPEVEKIIEEFIQERLLYNVLNTSTVFKQLPLNDRLGIIKKFVRQNMEKGCELIHQDEETSGFYIVMRGQMQVLYNLENGSQLPVGALIEGEEFGEISCLRKIPAMASVKALTPAIVLMLTRENFEALVMEYPQVLNALNEVSDRHWEQTLKVLEKKGIMR